MIELKIGDVWTIGSYENISFYGYGRDVETDEDLLIFENLGSEEEFNYVVIRKALFYDEDLYKVKLNQLTTFNDVELGKNKS